MIFQHWGATGDEVTQPVVGDDLCPDASLVATRSITIAAPPEEVFPWIRQMGMGRAGWYSYDWLDNLGRRSARTINPDWQDVHSGSRIPAGPTSFEAALVDPPRHFVLRTGFTFHGATRLCFTLAYELRDDPLGTRLVTRMRSRIALPGGRLFERLVLGPGDGLMLRRQLLGIKSRCEA